MKRKQTRGKAFIIGLSSIIVLLLAVGLGIYLTRQTSASKSSSAKSRQITRMLAAPTSLQYKLAKASPGVEGHNGVTTDGTYVYTLGDKLINKYLPSANWTSPWKLVASSPTAAIKSGAQHLGAGAYDPQNGYIYIAAENYSNPHHYDHQRIAVYRASDLSFVSETSIAAQGAEVSGLTLDPSRGVIYVSSFVQTDKVYEYHLSDYSYAGYIQLSQHIPQTQCITYKNNLLYIGEDATNRVYTVSLAGQILSTSPKAAKVNLEGIDYSKASMLILDEQNTRRVVWKVSTN